MCLKPIDMFRSRYLLIAGIAALLRWLPFVSGRDVRRISRRRSSASLRRGVGYGALQAPPTANRDLWQAVPQGGQPLFSSSGLAAHQESSRAACADLRRVAVFPAATVFF